MKISQVTITKTIQLKQYEPLTIQAVFEFDEDKNSTETIKKANRFVSNCIRAEMCRLELGSNTLSDSARQTREEFLKKHDSEEYF